MVAIIPLITAIATAISAIVGTIVDTGKAVLDTIIGFFQSVFSLLSSFIQSAPTPMKIAIFLFFILTFGNVFSNFFLGTRYACDGNGVLYETTDIAVAMSLMFKTQFQDLSAGERNQFVAENFDLAVNEYRPTRISCEATHPRLFFYSINLLSYRLWMYLLVIIFGVPLIWGYYSRMGALR